MDVGVFYRVFYDPKRPGSSSRVLNFSIPDTEDPETYPILEDARARLLHVHPSAKTITVTAVSRDGAILTTDQRS